MKTRLLIALAAVLVACATCAQLPDFDGMLEKMVKQGRALQAGRSDSQGVYIVALAEVSQTGKPDEACVEAMLRAKKDIASFLGDKVSAKVELKTTAVNEKIDEHFTQEMKTETSQMLRGVRQLSTFEKGEKKYFVFYTSERAADATAELQAAMRQEGNSNVVKALGLASSNGRKAEIVREQAINSAKMSAVEQVLGAALASTSQLMNDKAMIKTFSVAAGFVKTYRIVKEDNSIENLFQVVIIAEIAKDELQRSYDAYLKQMGNITFYIDAPPGTLLDLLTEKFVGWGFPIVNDPKAASYLIIAKEKCAGVVHPADGSDGTRATVSLSIVDALTTKELLTLNNEPKKSISFVGDSVRRKQLAITSAVSSMDAPLHERVNQLVGKMVNQGRAIQIIIEEYTPQLKSVLDDVVACIKTVPGCGEPTLSTDARDRVANLSCDYQGAIETFRDFMTAAMKAKLSAASCPEEVGISANQWRLSFDARASAASRR